MYTKPVGQPSLEHMSDFRKASCHGPRASATIPFIQWLGASYRLLQLPAEDNFFGLSEIYDVSKTVHLKQKLGLPSPYVV